jgi:hypothetical protein
MRASGTHHATITAFTLRMRLAFFEVPLARKAS